MRSLLLAVVSSVSLLPVARPVAGEEEAGYRVVPVAGGTVAGTCRLERAVEVPVVKITKCTTSLDRPEEPTPRLVFDRETLGLADCVVGLRSIREGKDWPSRMQAATALLRLEDARILPHVQWTRAGTQLAVWNGGPCEHCLHAYRDSFATHAFNFAVAVGTLHPRAADAFLKRPGRYLLRDDCHPWMNGTILVVEHPYYDGPTGTDGRYEIDHVPAETWEVVCWHEGMRVEAIEREGQVVGYDHGPDVEVLGTVTVDPGETATLDFTVPAPGP